MTRLRDFWVAIEVEDSGGRHYRALKVKSISAAAAARKIYRSKDLTPKKVSVLDVHEVSGEERSS